jgi:hypothetical protein
VADGPIKSDITTKSKRLKPAVQQMFGCGSAHPIAAASDSGIAPFQARRTNIDHRQVSFDHGVLYFMILHASNDAVSAPFVKPGWRLIASTLLSEMDFPIGSLSRVSSNSNQQPAAVGIRRFDQQRHLWTPMNFGSVIKHNGTKGNL